VLGLRGTAGRERFVVTLASGAPDLAEYHRLLKDDPAGVAAYVAQRRAALGSPELDAALVGVDGRIVERWWMSGQLTIEMKREGLATVRALTAVRAVTPDLPLQ
jgi:hypothetical protein